MQHVDENSPVCVDNSVTRHVDVFIATFAADCAAHVDKNRIHI